MAVLTHAVPAFTDACTGCGACLLTCPTHAIRPVVAARPGPTRATAGLTVLADRCTGCAECVEVCPADAVTVALDPVGRPDGRCGA